MVEQFYEIFKTDQETLKEIVIDELYDRSYKPVVGDGFVYAKGTIPILLVAHLDTVHKEIPKNIYYDKEQDVLWSPEGIGGDDRCGVWTILEIIKKYKPYVLFTEDEESGGKGVKKAVDILKAPKVKFIIEIDRRGSDDCVFYQCDNKEFQKYIETFGFKTAIGSYTDIVDLSNAWDIASVNLSAGYYREHTLQEYIRIKQTINTRDRVIKILEDEDKTYYKHEKKQYHYEVNYKSSYNATNKTSSTNTNNNKTTDVCDDWDDDKWDEEFAEYGYRDKAGNWHWHMD